MADRSSRLRISALRVMAGSFVLLVISSFAADSPAQRLFDESAKLIREKYVNPLGINLEQWLLGTQTELIQKCPEPCFVNQAEQILYDRIRQVGDFHFSWRSETVAPLEQDIPVGSIKRSRLFGFLTAESEQAVVIRFVQPDSAAAKSGLRKGDTVLSINGDASSSKAVRDALSKAEARGEPARLKIRRADGDEAIVTVTPTQSALWQPTLAFLDDETAVLQVPNAYTNDVADAEVHRLVNEAAQRGAKQMILDLRFNEGGVPVVSVKIAGAFLSKTGRIYRDKAGVTDTYQFSQGAATYDVSTKPGEVTRSTLKTRFALWEKPLRVLVTGSTVSSLENIADILQHAKRARIIGSPTRGGGGVVGNFFTLSNESILGLSTHRHYHLDGTPASMRITPDVLVPLDVSALSQGRDSHIQAALQDFKESR
jgi:carboxyl-terminal processing protease